MKAKAVFVEYNLNKEEKSKKDKRAIVPAPRKKQVAFSFNVKFHVILQK